MSHHEEMYQSGMWEMMSHFERVLYTPAFKRAYEDYFGSPFDYKRISLWSGHIAPYWLKPGTSKKYVTLIVSYRPYTLHTGPVVAVYEQDDLKSPGVFQPRK